MERKIQLGDLVYLKSGGPCMTVSRKRMEDGLFICMGFDNSVFFEIVVDPAALELAE